MKKLAFLTTFVFLIFFSGNLFAQRIPDPTDKIGIQYKLYFNSVVNIVSLEITTDILSDEAQQASNLGGLIVFYEKIFTDEFSAGIYGGQLNRQTKIRIDSIDSILKDNNLLIGAYAKAFSVRTRTNGLKYFISTYLEMMNINLEFENARPGLDKTTKSSQVMLIGFSGGIDYKLKFAAFQLEAGLTFGEQRVNFNTHEILFKFDTPFIAVNIMSLF